MTHSKTSQKSAPRPYFRKHSVPHAPASTAERHIGRWAIRGATVVTAFAMIFSVFTPAHATTNPYGDEVQKKIILCHWDASDAYKSSGDIDVSAAYNPNNPSSGHNGHDLDIIPPFHYKDGNSTGFYPGKNWTDTNEDIWDGGTCLGDGIIPTTGTLTLVKALAGDPAPDATTAWTLSASGATNISGATGSSSVTNAIVTAGSYSLSESGPTTNYTSSSFSCVKNQSAAVSGNTINIAVSDSVTCTITNTYHAPVVTGSLTVTKNTIGADGTFNFSGTGPTAISNFSITTSGNTNSQTITGLTPGSYTITETSSPDANWSKTGDTCTAVVVTGDHTSTCTITNTYTAPRTSGTLTVKKVIVGSNATPDQFSFKVNGGSAIAFDATDGQNDMTVAAGNYTITEVADSNYTTTYDNCTEIDLVVDGTQVCTITNTLIVTPTYSLSGKVYNDNNSQNGELDSETEAGLPGWTVNLYHKGDSSVFHSTETDGSGNYSFTGLDAGCYIVSEVLQSGWNETDPTVSDDSAQGVVTDGEYQVALGGASCATQISFLDFFIHTAQAIAINTNVTDLNFGNVAIPSGCTSNCGGGGGGGGGSSINNVLSGFKYNDLNRNGTRDAGEVGLAGWTIYLDGNNNGTFDNGEAFRTTAADGSYSFNNMNPGTYTVREVGQSGWTQYEPGTAAGSQWTVTVTSSSSKTDANFGNAQGQVLGEVTTTPSNPQVLGASTELPRTGMSLSWLLVVATLATAAAFSGRKLSISKK